MASNNSSATGTVYLDTNSAQAALDKLNNKIKQYDDELKQANTTAARRMTIEADRATVATKAAAINQQIEKGLGSTYNQQAILIKTLTSQTKNLAMGSEEYRQKLAELGKAQVVFDEMKVKINGVNEAQKSISAGGISKFSIAAGSLIASAAQNALSFLKAAVSESVELALKGEGIKNAFDKLNRPELLDELRKATKGTVSDLNLMQKAVQANNFQIPLDTLATMLQFAQRRARETGESVDYLVDSIVTGIARKSPLILDNLGINIQRIQKEFEKTGDFAKAAMVVVNDELAKAGPQIDLMADKVSRVSATWDNIKTSAGSFFLTLGDGLINSYDAIFHHQELVTRKENELMAEEFKKSQDGIIGAVRTFNTNYSKADKDGRAKIVEQVREQIRITEFLENQAVLNGESQLSKTLNFKLQSYKKFISDVTAVALKPGETIGGIEGELQTLNQMLKTSKIGSEQFIKTQARIKELNAQLDAANGTTAAKNLKDGESAAKKAEAARKKAEEENKRLFDQYNDFVKGLNRSIADILTPEASKKFVAILRQSADETEKLKKLAQSDEQFQKGKLLILERQKLAIHALVEEEGKLFKPAKEQATTVDASLLTGQLKNLVKKKPVEVPIEIVPEIAPEDEKAVSAALANVLSRLQRDSKAGFQLDVLTATNARDRKNALLAQLADEHEVEMENKDLTDNEKLVKEAEYQGKRRDIIFQYQQEIVGYIQEGLEFANQVVDVLGRFAQAQATKENAELARDSKLNDAKKAAYKKQLDSKLISQQKYSQQVAELDRDLETKKEEIEKKQFERNKRLQLAQTGINAAAAAVRLWVDPGFPAAIPLAIALGIETAAQIALIANQKFAGGGQVQQLKNGKITQAPNIPTQPNGDDVLATVKVGEVILNEEQQRRLGGAATFRSIGVPGFAGGGVIKPFWQTRPYRGIDYGRVTQTIQVLKYADGGRVAPHPGPLPVGGEGVSQPDPAVLEDLRQSRAVNIALMETISGLNQQLADGIYADVSLDKLDKANAKRNRIKADSQMR